MSNVIAKAAAKSKQAVNKLNDWMDKTWPFKKMSKKARALLGLSILIIPGSIAAYFILVVIHNHISK